MHDHNHTPAPQNAPAPQPVRPPFTPLEDARFVPFENAALCDLNAMNDAVNLVLADPAVVNTIAQIRGPGDTRVDFNNDNNPQGATSHEWASALIAASQIAYERGLRLQDVPAHEIEERGCKIYSDFQVRLHGEGAQTCNSR